MRRYPVIILIGALMAVAVGVGMLSMAGRIDDAVWFAVPIIALGLLLAWLWVRDRAATRNAPPLVGSTPEPPPGKWYPVALLGIVVMQFAWFIYWMKFRK
jgi:hypothetical protein